MDTHEIPVATKKLVRALTVTTVLLLVASVIAGMWEYGFDQDSVTTLVHLFELNEELNVPSFFSTLLLLGAGLILACVTQLKRAGGDPMVSKWATLSVGFVVMAYDEAFSVHERLVTPMRSLLGGHEPGVLYYAWVVPGIVLVVLLGLYFVGFLRSLPTQVRRTFLLAGLIYLVAAIGIEMIEGNYADVHGDKNLGFAMLTNIEESMEMVGVIIFLDALLAYIGRTYEVVHFRIQAPSRESDSHVDGL